MVNDSSSPDGTAGRPHRTPVDDQNSPSRSPAAPDPKASILCILRGSPLAVSGEYLSAVTGISRVAVWKHIRGLTACGYRITSSRKGYLYEAAPDPFSMFEFPGQHPAVLYRESLDSTMLEALRNPLLADGTVLLAGRQTAGRGRLGRSWVSEPGGLYFSLVQKKPIPFSRCWRYGFAASLALRAALLHAAGITAEVKWPNDLLVDGKKIAGVLADIRGESGMVTGAVVGIGVNVNNPVPPGATSAGELAGREISRKVLLELFLVEYHRRILECPDDGLLSEWRSASITLGTRVRIDTGTSFREGTALDLDNNGGLIIENSDGSRESIYYGDIIQLQ